MLIKQLLDIKARVGRKCKDGHWRALELLKKNGAKYLGEGCGRIAFQIDIPGYEPTVLKFISDPFDDLRDGLSGIEQNRHEIQIYKQYGDHPYIPRIFDWDAKNSLWIEMELLTRPAGGWGSLPTAAELQAFLKKVPNLRPDEVNPRTRRDHWGMDFCGRPKLLDLGASRNAPVVPPLLG